VPHDGGDLLALWQSLVRVCEPILSSRDDAEDCASDALVCALTTSGAVDNREAWLVTVAKRRAMDQLRHRVRSRTRAQRLVGHGETPAPDIAEAVADDSEARWLSGEAEQLLTCAARSVLDVVVAGGSVDDAASELGITRRSAEAHLHRARTSLRAHARREAGGYGRRRPPATATR
jgi:DNA-directed RNA polymerase specialized sigma24 family protein